MPTKYARDDQFTSVFRNIIKENNISSQEELAAKLAMQGYEGISQSKVSRILKKMGAVKVRNANHEIVYDVPDALHVPKVRNTIESVVLSIRHNGTQIVMKSSIGCAPMLARMVDNLDDSFNILGTIAGDDTLLIIPANTEQIDWTVMRLKEFLQVREN